MTSSTPQSAFSAIRPASVTTATSGTPSPVACNIRQVARASLNSDRASTSTASGLGPATRVRTSRGAVRTECGNRSSAGSTADGSPARAVTSSRISTITSVPAALGRTRPDTLAGECAEKLRGPGVADGRGNGVERNRSPRPRRLAISRLSTLPLIVEQILTLLKPVTVVSGRRSGTIGSCFPPPRPRPAANRGPPGPTRARPPQRRAATRPRRVPVRPPPTAIAANEVGLAEPVAPANRRADPKTRSTSRKRRSYPRSRCTVSSR